MTDILTTAQVLRHVADNMDAGRPEGCGLQFEAAGTFKDAVSPVRGTNIGIRYRLKPRTRMLNGFEVPAPMDVMPDVGSRYWVIDACDINGSDDIIFSNDAADQRAFNRGFMFATREDAIANFKAICGEDPNK